MPLNITRVREKLAEFQSKDDILTRLVKQYQAFGYQIKPGDIFYKTVINEEEVWGLKIGQLTHSCHIDTTEYVVLFILGYGHSELKGVPDIFLADSLTV